MKRAPVSLTEKRIERLKTEASASRAFILWDADVTGFGCKVHPSGKKSFIVSYRFQRRQRQITIGPFPTLTVNDARDRARRIIVSAIDGVDPLKLREVERAKRTVQELVPEFVRARSNLKSIRKYESRLRRYLLPFLGTAVVSTVTTEDLTRLHRRIVEQAKPIEANRVIEVAHSFFEFARECGEIDRLAENPAKAVSRTPEISRDRYVREDEMPRLIQAINDYESKNYFVSKLLWCYLLTGQRKDELRLARWENIDFGAARLRIPGTKNGTTHYLPISQRLRELLQSLKRVSGNPFLFPTGFGSRPIALSAAQLDRAWRKIRKATGLEDVTLHDLRRTVASWLAQHNCSLGVVGEVLNHKDPQSTKVYARFSDKEVTRALDQHGERIFQAASVGALDDSKQKEAA